MVGIVLFLSCRSFCSFWHWIKHCPSGNAFDFDDILVSIMLTAMCFVCRTVFFSSLVDLRKFFRLLH